MPAETLLAFLVFLFPLAYSPGPGNMFFAALGARFGLPATWPASLGYHLATFAMTLLIGFGFGVILRTEPGIMLAIQYAGAAYVLYLAWKFFNAGRFEKTAEARKAGFLDGVILLLLNPKGYVIMALIFSQFLSAQEGASVRMVVLISLVFTLNNFIAFSVWSYAGDFIGRLFRTERSARYLNTGFSLTLAGVAVWVLMR